MKLIRLLWIAPALLGSCGIFDPEKPAEDPEKKAPEGPKLIGRIASIPADKRFVLIQSYEKWNVESGSILTTRGPEERTANLRATGEVLGQFAAADLQSGTVEVGDAVYSRHIPKPPEPVADVENVPELPDTALKVDSENVQKNN